MSLQGRERRRAPAIWDRCRLAGCGRLLSDSRSARTRFIRQFRSIVCGSITEGICGDNGQSDEVFPRRKREGPADFFVTRIWNLLVFVFARLARIGAMPIPLG